MGRLFVRGGIGVVAFVAAWLLFAGGAAAQSSTLPFTVSPTTGTFPSTHQGATSAITLTFTWTASEPGSIGNFQTSPPNVFYIRTSTCGPTIAYQGTCTVTLDFAPAGAGGLYSGNLTLAYGGSQPGTDQFPLSGTGIPTCHCTRVSAEFTDFKQETGEYTFRLKWTLHCEGKYIRRKFPCEGFLGAGQPKSLPKGLRLRYESGGPKKLSNGGFFCRTHHPTCAYVDFYCFARRGTCAARTGAVKVWLIGSAAHRANADIKIRVRLVCVDGSRRVPTLSLKFDAHGNLDRQASELGLN
jgi:hypothetical protein